MFKSASGFVSWFWPCAPEEEEVELRAHLSHSLNKIEDMLKGRIFTYQSCLKIANEEEGLLSAGDASIKFNPSIRKMYNWTGPVEVVLAGMELYFLYHNKQINNYFLPVIDEDAENQTLALIETWIELILIGAMLTAGACDFIKKYLWPFLHQITCVKSSLPFQHGSMLDKLYQMLGRIEGVAGLATLGILVYEEEGFNTFREIWAWALPTVATLMVFIDLVMHLVATRRLSSPLPTVVRHELSLLLQQVCKQSEETLEEDNETNSAWEGRKTFAQWIIEKAKPDRMKQGVLVNTYEELENLFNVIQEVQAAFDKATQNAYETCFTTCRTINCCL